MYPDGQPVDIRLFGAPGPVLDGTAAGVVPAPGGRGLLQVVSIRDIGLVTAHPAQVSPAGTSPYDGLPVRDRQRFDLFDQAEAAGRPSARLPAHLIDPGDRLPAAPGLLPDCTVTSAAVSRRVVASAEGADGVFTTASASAGGVVTITAAGGPGDLPGRREFAESEPLDVALPARHPAQNGPHASRLFAARPAAAPPAHPALPAAGTREQLAALTVQMQVIDRRRLAGVPPGSPAPGWERRGRRGPATAAGPGCRRRRHPRPAR